MNTILRTNKTIGVLLLCLISFGFAGTINQPNINDLVENAPLVQEGDKTFRVQYDNYYDVDYESNLEGVTIKINNPCLKVEEANGTSMKPYWDNNELIIFDTCFPVEDLEVGDVILYYKEWDISKVHHRIVDINFEDEWFRTQGDNPETNSNPDDLVGFDRYYAKSIGFLNVLEDKKIVKKEEVNYSNYLNFSTSLLFFENITWYELCSSERAMIVRASSLEELDRMKNDSFVISGGFNEENCIDSQNSDSGSEVDNG